MCSFNLGLTVDSLRNIDGQTTVPIISKISYPESPTMRTLGALECNGQIRRTRHIRYYDMILLGILILKSREIEVCGLQRTCAAFQASKNHSSL